MYNKNICCWRNGFKNKLYFLRVFIIKKIWKVINLLNTTKRIKKSFRKSLGDVSQPSPKRNKIGLMWESPSPRSCERLTKWLRGYYLINNFKKSVAIILTILSVFRVVLRFLDDKIILKLSYLTFRSIPP